MAMRFAVAALAAAVWLACASAALAGSMSGPAIESLQVRSFTDNLAGPAPVGTRILVTLLGSAGGKAWFAIPNVLGKTPMPETAPGVYVGHWTVDAGKDVVGGRIIGRLDMPGGLKSPMLFAAKTVTIDTSRPKLTGIFPADGDVVAGHRPVMYCGFDDGAGTGIDISAVKVQVDGRDVTAQCRICPAFVSYQSADDLPDGPHTLFVSAADSAGNRTWTIVRFTVVSPNTAGNIEITKHALATVSPGAVLDVACTGPAGGKASLTVPPLAQTIQLAEVQPGQYAGKFELYRGQGSIDGAPGITAFTHGGKTVYSTVDRPITITGDGLKPPTITLPSVQYSFIGQIGMAGTAAPGDLVLCTVGYQSRSSGGVMPFTGNAMSAVTRVDGKGKWQMGPFRLDLQVLFAGQRDSSVTVTAVAIDPSGSRSAPATVGVDYSQ